MKRSICDNCQKPIGPDEADKTLVHDEVIYVDPSGLCVSSAIELDYREKAVERIDILMDQTGNSLLEVVDYMKDGPMDAQLIAWATLYDDDKMSTWSGPIWADFVVPDVGGPVRFFAQAE